MKTLVFIEQRNGKLKSSAFEVMTAARNLVDSADEMAAIIVGKDSANLASELKGFGANTVYTCDATEVENYNIASYCAAVDAAVKEFSPAALIGIASPMGRDIFPRLAARHNGGLITDMVELKNDSGKISGVKPMYAGKCLAKVGVTGDGLQLATIRQNVFAASKNDSGDANSTPLTCSFPADSRIKTVEIRAGKSEKPDLTEASVIISGGRSIGNAENFKILHECADVIGATVGASRAAVDSGYAGHEMQVGQTGKTVNPNLYIACGISGAVQHMAGMRTSKVIVAINTDEEAPIFKVADYGIVGDLFEVVPELTKKFKELLG